MLAAGAMLTQGKRIPAGQLWAGRPAKYVRDLSEADLAGMRDRRRPLCRAGEAHAAALSALSRSIRCLLARGERLRFGDRCVERLLIGGAGRQVGALQGELVELGERPGWSGRAPLRAARSPAAPRPSSPSLAAPARAAARSAAGESRASNARVARPAPRRRRAAICGAQAPRSSATTGASRTGSSIASPPARRGAARAKGRGPARRSRRAGRPARASEDDGALVHPLLPMRRPPPATPASAGAGTGLRRCGRGLRASALPPMSHASRAPVAQLDRAPDYESGGRRFESFRARQGFLRFRQRRCPEKKGAPEGAPRSSIAYRDQITRKSVESSAGAVLRTANSIAAFPPTPSES